MCLCTKQKEPLVAQRNIKVYKHVSYIDDDKKTAKSLCQGTRFNLNADFVPDSSTVDITGHTEHLEINGGVIHACLYPDYGRGRCLVAYIPKGTEYWFGLEGTTVCAKKLHVTNQEVTPENFAGMDEELATQLYSDAPSFNGIKVGCFLVKNTDDSKMFVSPIWVNDKPAENIIGIVVGFTPENKPIIASHKHYLESTSIDNRYDCSLNDKYLSKEEARKDFNGYKNFKGWKKVCEGNPTRFEAYAQVTAFGEEYYVPALGEMECMLENIKYVAAGFTLAGRNCPVSMPGWYWTSSGRSADGSWVCGIGSDGVRRGWFGKDAHGRVVPFVAFDGKAINSPNLEDVTKKKNDSKMDSKDYELCKEINQMSKEFRTAIRKTMSKAQIAEVGYEIIASLRQLKLDVYRLCIQENESQREYDKHTVEYQLDWIKILIDECIEDNILSMKGIYNIVQPRKRLMESIDNLKAIS